MSERKSQSEKQSTSKTTKASKAIKTSESAGDSLLRAEALSDEIERLAQEMKANKRPGRMNLKVLQQIDELSELLRRQRGELLEEADKATDVLEVCQDELQRVSQNEQTFERLKVLQANERARQREDRKAA